MLKVINNIDLDKYNLKENVNLRTNDSKVYNYRIDDYYIDISFIITNKHQLIFDTSAYGADQYDVSAFAELIYKMTLNHDIYYEVDWYETIRKQTHQNVL